MKISSGWSKINLAEIHHLLSLQTKCDKYWPDVGKQQVFGNITVTMESENLWLNYTVRRLKVAQVGTTGQTQWEKSDENITNLILCIRHRGGDFHSIGPVSALIQSQEFQQIEKRHWPAFFNGVGWCSAVFWCSVFKIGVQCYKWCWSA